MLKRVFGQNNEKIILLLEKLIFRVPTCHLCAANIDLKANMNMGYAKLQYSPLLNMTRKVSVNTDVKENIE